MAAITIRRARPAEAAGLSEVALASKRDWGYPKRWLDAWAIQLTVSADYVRANPVYVARKGTHIAGFFALLQGPEGWALDHFWIHPDDMGQGLGRRLMAHAVRYLKRRRVRLLRIVADPNAVGFYQKMGATKVGSVAAPVGTVKRRLPVLELRI